MVWILVSSLIQRSRSLIPSLLVLLVSDSQVSFFILFSIFLSLSLSPSFFPSYSKWALGADPISRTLFQVPVPVFAGPPIRGIFCLYIGEFSFSFSQVLFTLLVRQYVQYCWRHLAINHEIKWIVLPRFANLVGSFFHPWISSFYYFYFGTVIGKPGKRNCLGNFDDRELRTIRVI